MFETIGYSGYRDETLMSIIRAVPNFSTRPAYTAGRGALLSDLDSDRLELIYRGILRDFGKRAANAYVKMVSRLKVASASAFLIELYDLCNNGWKLPRNWRQRNAAGIDVDKNENGDYKVGDIGGTIGLMVALTHSGEDQTRAIVSPFLRKHGIKPKDEYFGNGYVTQFYN